MKNLFITALFISCVNAVYTQPNYIHIQLSEKQADAQKFNMGANINPAGETIEIDSESMRWNGRRVIPVMGEIHYARVPASEWRTELLKMQAGGINIISTYIFWIHHEEIEGQYDWTGQRDLRAFVQICKDLNFKVVLRIGPWSHGEARNGGFPDWLATSGIKLRQNNPAYMEKVKKWYSTIFEQVKGLMWKDGGTVIGIQIENEYRGKWEHLAKLKEIAFAAGFDVPLYTRTGWPALATPAAYGELIPLYGDYPDGFWDRSLNRMPGAYSNAYLFRPFRRSTVIATEQLGVQSEMETREDAEYPYFTCELGGGMMPSYHRRINIAPMDIYALALVKIGSGSNLPGYYMYHGGTNPDGKLTYLNELQATPMTNYNDLPVKSYDFQAPVGEAGQINEHYYLLRDLHLFLHNFGETLSVMPAFFPESSQLRWSVRSDGDAGYLFVNNYQRLEDLSEKRDVQFFVDLPNEKLVFPETPFTVPQHASFFLPFNMDLSGVKLQYATAQPVSKEETDNSTTCYFRKITGIPADFVVGKNDLKSFDSEKSLEKNGKIYFQDVQKKVSFKNKKNRIIHIVLLDEENVPEITIQQTVAFSQVQPVGKLRTISIGVNKVAESPTDSDFADAAVWNVNLPENIDFQKDSYMIIHYVGDVARLYAGDCLLTDNFYNGKTFEINLRYFKDKIKDNKLILKILPFQKGSPVYLPVEMDFEKKNAIAELKSIELRIKGLGFVHK
jgi:hypothetical protein